MASASTMEHAREASLPELGGEEGQERAEGSLQEAFQRFLKRKKVRTEEKLQLKERQSAEAASQLARRDQQAMHRLREKFLDTALSYCGVPYARRYHPPDSPTHHSPLFLDCCGLVRRVVRELRDEFGFTIGPGNQAYQYDTLPIALSGPEQMQPGDLVFITGHYFNTHSKPQKHDMVHVEIWLGEGEKTLGARWQRGRVEVHSSYQFVSKSYHSMQYHFRSIDTWLSGVCRSVCPEHPWTTPHYNPGKYSLFALDGGDDAEEEEEEEEEGGCGGEGEEEEGAVEGLRLNTEQYRHCLAPPDLTEGLFRSSVIDRSSGSQPQKEQKVFRPAPKTHRQTNASSSSSSSSSGQGHTPTGSSGQPGTSRACRPRQSGVRSQARLFIICGGNGAKLVREALQAKGWTELHDKASPCFTLKWVESNRQLDHVAFREGRQMVNHFPNISLLTTKIGLLESLRGFQRLQHRAGARGLAPSSFLPETYRLDVEEERSEFTRTHSPGDVWICKPTGANQGKGIFIVRDIQQVLDKLEGDKKNCKIASRPTARIIQRYISSPMLLDGRKFDVRAYLLVLAARPYLVLYREGYVRLSCLHYDAASPEPCVHLTNQYQQKKHPLFADKREDTVWNMAQFQSYLTTHLSLPEDWVASILTPRMKAIMTTCFQSVSKRLSHKVGYFDLLGFDFMVDSEMKVWLIEVNINPALHTNCSALAAVMPTVVKETLDIAIEVYFKCTSGHSLLPLSSSQYFTLLNC